MVGALQWKRRPQQEQLTLILSIFAWICGPFVGLYDHLGTNPGINQILFWIYLSHIL